MSGSWRLKDKLKVFWGVGMQESEEMTKLLEPEPESFVSSAEVEGGKLFLINFKFFYITSSLSINNAWMTTLQEKRSTVPGKNKLPSLSLLSNHIFLV